MERFVIVVGHMGHPEWGHGRGLLRYLRRDDQAKKERYIALLERFVTVHGDKKVIITCTPGRLNLLGRHIDHRGGGINDLAVDRDATFVSSPRKDDIFSVVNVDCDAYPDRTFSVSEIIGSDLGGCVIALVRKESAEQVIAMLNREYYDKYGYAHSDVAYTLSSGSAVIDCGTVCLFWMRRKEYE